jgi:hypothetical protein
MKIVRAMKEISRIKGEIKDLKHRMDRCINTVEGNEFPEDFQELWAAYHNRSVKLIQLKNAVMESNIKNGMFNHILRLGELKHYMEFLKELNIRAGINPDRFGDSSTTYISQLTVKAKMATIEKVQKEINDITDKLDDFNARMDIGEVDVTVQPLPEIKSQS